MTEKKKYFIGCFNRSVIITYLGIGFSLIGICLLMTADFSESCDKTALAMSCLILAGICDLFDGFVARKCKRNEVQKKFGIQIDSLCDVISFIVFPSVLLYRINFMSGILKNISIIVIFVYVVCGITRLAWFNILTGNENKTIHYQGLPVTYSALIIPIIYTIITRIPILLHYMNIIFIITYVIISLLFILNVKIKKPTGIWYGIFSILAIAVIVLLLI